MKKIINFPFLLLIIIYQKVFYFKPRTCRFYPSCSEYALQAFQKYDLLKALFLTIKRLLSCHPFNKNNGFDPLT